MAQNLTNYDAVLKEFYEGSIRETLNNEIVLLKHLEQSDRQYSGRRVVFPVHLGRNVGVGARGEGGALPTAGQQSNNESRITAAFVYARIDVSGPVMAASKHAFAEAMSHEIDGAVADLRFDISRQTYGEGQGILAEIANTVTTSNITVQNRFFEPGHPGARYLQVGQDVDHGVASALTATSLTIQTITIAANSGTTTDNYDVSASTHVSLGAAKFAFNVGAAGIEIMGLRGIIDDQTAANLYGQSGGMFGNVTLQNIDRNSQTRWNATVLANSQTERVLDSYLVQRAFDSVQKKSGKMVDMIIGEYDTVSAFLDSVNGDRRFNSKGFDAGYSELSYNGIPLVKDLNAPYNELFLFNRMCLQWYTLADFQWADDDNAILKNVSGFDRWEAFLRFFGNLGTEGPNGSCVIRDIKVDL